MNDAVSHGARLRFVTVFAAALGVLGAFGFGPTKAHGSAPTVTETKKKPAGLKVPQPPGEAEAEACGKRRGGKWINSQRAVGCQVNGQREGRWLDLENGQVLQEASYRKGERHGPARLKAPADDSLTDEGMFVDGLRDGAWKTVDDREVTVALMTYARGKREGVAQEWFRHGQMSQEQHWRGDRLNGPHVTWHGGCSRKETGAYLDGLKTGTWTRWHPNGEKSEEGVYTRGQRTGTWTFWATNGAKTHRGPYVKGEAHGRFTEWFINGQLWREADFSEGFRTAPAPGACRGLTKGLWEVNYKTRTEGCIAEPNGPKKRGRQGLWKTYYGDGSLAQDAVHVDGQKHGLVIDYHDDGAILRRGAYKDGIPEGEHVWRAPDGKVWAEVSVNDGGGRWEEWHPSGFRLISGVYRSGKKDEQWTTYHPNGAQAEFMTYLDGDRHGPLKDWFRAGGLRAEGAYEKDLRSGAWKAYWMNGAPLWAGSYIDGRRHGVWRNWYANGQLKRVGELVSGKLEGLGTEYHNNGNKSAEGLYEGGKRVGVWQMWWYNGLPWRKVRYRAGIPDSRALHECAVEGGGWVEDAQARRAGCTMCRWDPVKEAVVESRQGEWTWWHANGTVERRGNFHGGNRQGEWMWYHDSGRPMLQGVFKDNIEQGRWMGWLANGKPKFDGEYVDGRETGRWTMFHADGARKAAGLYVAKLKTGAWEFFHKNGVVKERGTFLADMEIGDWHSFHPNGAKKAAGQFWGGKREGEWTWWRPDGTIWRKAFYVVGRETQNSQPPR